MLANIIFALIFLPPQEAFDAVIVPEGYSKQLIAAEPHVMDPVAFCIDDEGDILVAESFRQENAVPDNRSSPFWLLDDIANQTVEDRLAMYEYWSDQRVGGMDFYSEFEERVRHLRDADHDGIFETVSIFADGFNEPLDGTGAGLIALEDEVWYTMIPSLIKFNDANRDGYADSQEIVYYGFGVRIALRGHDMHGLAIGLDGRLYWSIGDRGYHLELEDGQILHSPGTGAVFRCELDGSGLELFHHGLRNPQELAFDQYGNLFTGDNNSDAGDKARLVYCVEGGETGWRMEYQTLGGENQRGPWVQENVWDPHAKERPAWALPAIDIIGSGPSGFTYYPGAGLAPKYDDSFFLCDFTGGASHSRVLSFKVKPKGASFFMEDLHPFVEGVLCTDVDFAYNGKMIVSDWGEGWVGNEEGRLYSIWDEKYVAEGDVSSLFREGFIQRPTNELITMLGHVDRRVRLRAQLVLSKRDVVSELVQSLDISNQLAKIHGMWTLAMMQRRGVETIDYIIPLLEDSDAEIRAQACRIIGESGETEAFDNVLFRLNDESPRVVFFATIAAGHLGNPRDEVLSLLSRNANSDVYLRHAAVVALATSQYPSALANLAMHKDSAVRLAAVLALRKLESPLLSNFLSDSNQDVATEATRAIHDVPVAKALGSVAESLPEAKGYAWQRRALSASERLGLDVYLHNVISFALDDSNSIRMRMLALQILNTWQHPPVRERVDGKWWPAKQTTSRNIELIRDGIPKLIAHLSESLTDPTVDALLFESLKLAQKYKVGLPEELSYSILEDDSQSVGLRVHCLRSLKTESAIEYGLQNEAWELRAAARQLKLERQDSDAIEVLLKTVEKGVFAEAQAAIHILDQTSLSKIKLETLPVSLQLDYAEATSTENTLGDPMEGEWLINGGDVARGKRIVFEHSNAQCLRCHKVNGSGGIAGPQLDQVGSRLTGMQLLGSLIVPAEEIVDGFGDFSAMPPMDTKLSNQELRDVVAYLKSLK